MDNHRYQAQKTSTGHGVFDTHTNTWVGPDGTPTDAPLNLSQRDAHDLAMEIEYA